MINENNIKPNPLKVNLLFGEAYELANYIGMLSVVKNYQDRKSVV